MKISFLKFENEHREYVWLTYVSSMKPHIEKIWGWENSWQEENFSNSLNIYSTYILISGEKKLGYIQFRHDKDFTFLSMIVLHKEYRSTGFGPAIIDKIQAMQPELPIQLRCFKVNQAAYRFYIKNGFQLMSSDNEFHTLRRNKASSSSAA